MAEMASVAAGSEHHVNRELVRLGPDVREAELEFWDKDLFSPNDLLGRIQIRWNGAGQVDVVPGASARQMDDGSFHLTGEGGDYRIWLSFDER